MTRRSGTRAQPRWPGTVLLVLATAAWAQPAATAPADPALQRELLAMRQADQSAQE
jgi:hypothetical protein